ncbi:hypothetical protein EZV62_026070 [Acer yangbiense]|uniref:Splicing factor cactin central domain-containing protein n=1 Tax=Acer yangbiense TaxID=1000413 RepID=A0A5C7GRB5_9ROSI|nr:hypothetical protein EZV62_026070 [Acer yangbiense]
MGTEGKSNKSKRDTLSSKKKKVTEEEIAEYLAKKVERVAKKLKTRLSGYSNDSNPFGDSNLKERFVWRKKIERDVTQGVDMLFSVKAEKKRQREFEKVKKKREERALEKTQHEEEMAVLARERDRAEFQDWEKKDKEFDFNQSKLRSEIRLREGRIKPIDVLCNHLNGQINQEPSYTIFRDLTVKEMEKLHDDIKMYLNFDRATPTHVNYWKVIAVRSPSLHKALKVVCDWELDRAKVCGQEMRLHSSIEEDVMRLLQGKTHSELEALQTQIESHMSAGTAKVVEFWEHLQCCPVQPETQEAEEEEKEADESFSPQLLHGDENEEAIDPVEDRAILEGKRMVLLEEQQRLAPSEDMGAMNLDSQVYWWHDKYRPRKPKYFDRVHIGYNHAWPRLNLVILICVRVYNSQS